MEQITFQEYTDMVKAQADNEDAEDLVFDRIVGDKVHFIQANGKGMAWYDLKEVQEYLAKAEELASSASKLK